MSVSFDVNGEKLSRLEFLKRSAQYDFHIKEHYLGRCLGGSGTSEEYVMITGISNIQSPNYSNGYSVSDFMKDTCHVVIACSLDGVDFGYLKTSANGPFEILILDDYGNSELWVAGTSVSDTEYHFASAGRYRIFSL